MGRVSAMKRKNIIRIIGVLAFLVILFVLRDYILQIDVERIIVERYNINKAILIIWGFFLLKSIIFIIPIKLIYIASGMVLPLFISIGVNLVGVTLAMTLTYILGYFLGRDFVDRLSKRFPLIKKIMDFNTDKEEAIAFFLRLIPFNLESVSLTLGASGNQFVRYLFASLLGLLPKLLLFTMIGEALVRPLTPGLIIGMTAIIISWVLTLILVRKKFLLGDDQQDNNSGESDPVANG